MAEDEEYWNSTSKSKAFDFNDEKEDGENVLKLFGISAHWSASAPVPSDPPPDDFDLRSTTSDDPPTVRSEETDEEPTSKSSGRTCASRTRSTLSKSSLSSSGPSILVASPTLSNSSKLSVKSGLGIHPTEAAGHPRNDLDSSSTGQLLAEIQYLRRNLDASRKDQWIKLSPKDMVWRILQNKPYGLENYRSLEEKLALLDQALNFYDSNAVIIAILHMKHTLGDNIFVQELASKPEAVDQYVAYLMENQNWRECLDLLDAVGRIEEASNLQLRIALQHSDVQERLKNLDLCIKRHNIPSPGSQPSPNLHNLRALKSLLEIQRPIDENDEKSANDPRNEVFMARFPRVRSLIGLSLIDTLHYCCLYHYDQPETNFSSPQYIRKMFGISEKQFVWVAVDALSKCQKWTEIQALLTDRTGWFGAPKPKAVIGFDKVCDVLIRNGTPPDVLAYYLRLIEDPEVRLDLARKSRCHSVTIDTLAALKQFDKLQEYATKLDPGAPEFHYLQDVMQKNKLIK